MKWEELLKIVKDQPVVETYMLTNQVADLPKLRVQLSRWVKAKKLNKIKNGIYLLSENYRTKPSRLDYLSTLINRPSYISFEYALADYGLIPELIPNITLITTRRPIKRSVEGRLFIYRNVKKELFWGFVAKGEKNFEAFYAEPEKALLDLLYFTRGKIDDVFIDELRLQNTEILDSNKLMEYAKRFDSPKILRAAKYVCRYLERQKGFKEI